MATAPASADAVLVRRLRERDRTAWAELYDEYAPRLRPFAYRLTGNRHDADDLVQETFVRALPRLDRLDPRTVQLGPYLFTTLRNLFFKSVERGRRAQPVADVPEPSVPAPIEDDPERSALLRRQQEEVRSANARLDPRQRLVLALRELEDRSYAEIGVVVGLNENAVAQLISRARESLRTELRLAQVEPSRLPDACRRFLPLLSRHLDGRLRGPQLEQTLAHLESCERCQDALASMREAQRRYRVLPPLFGGSDEQRERIESELASTHYWAGPRKRLGGRAMLVAGSAGLLIAGAGGIRAALVATNGGPPAAAPAISRAATSTAAARSNTVATTRTTGTTGTTTAATTRTTTAPSTKSTKTAKPSLATPPTTPTTTHSATTAPVVAPPKTTTAVPVEPATTAVIDLVAPTVTIVTRPPSETTRSDASFSFRAGEAGATFACRLDGDAFKDCSSPAAYHALAPGVHRFVVRARDAAGNTGAAAVAAWTVLPPPDTTPPTVTIVSAAASGSDITFEFTSSEPGSAFACSLDGGGFEACASPRAYSALAPGPHTLAVHATDAAGNRGNAAMHSWTVARPLPDVVVSALGETGFTVTNAGTAAAGPFVVTVTLIGTFSFSGLAPGQSAARTWSACRVGTLLAVADRGRTVAESNEDNNTRSVVSDC